MRIVEWTDGVPSADLRINDIVVEINQQPANWKIWSSLFPVQLNNENEQLELSIWREGEVLTVFVAIEDIGFDDFQSRLPVILTAIFAWIIGAIVVLYATPQNRDAWQLGVTTIFASVLVIASEAALYGVPGAWLSTPLLPILAISWIHVAMIPHVNGINHREKIVFRLLYTIAGVVGFIFLFELLFITPSGASIQLMTGISTYAIALSCVMIGLLGHFCLLLWRYFKMPVALKYHRQQLRIILVFSTIAYLPAIILTILPNIILGRTFLPWLLAFPLLALGIIGYAFVIFRRNYLNLDIVTTQALASILVAIFLVTLFSILFYVTKTDAAIVVLGVMLFLFPRKKIRQFTDGVIYGDDRDYDLTQITSNLSVKPQLGTLQKTVRDLCDILNIRHIELLLVDKNKNFMPISQADSIMIKGALSIEVCEKSFDLHEPIIITEETESPLLEIIPWVNYVVPLVANNETVGLLLVGRPVPDGYLNAVQAGFIRQIANVMAVTIEAIQRFDTLRLVARKLLSDRYETQLSLANRIHNEPLQKISSLKNDMLHFSKNNSSGIVVGVNGWVETLESTATQLREICADLHPPVFDQGPKWAVREVVSDFRDKSDIEIHLSINVPNELETSRKVTKAIYNILIESMNNVCKHANATAIWVFLTLIDSKQLLLQIRDDGKSETINFSSLVDPIRNHHFGIIGMYEEADLVNGRLDMSLHPDGGMLVTLEVPLDQQDDDAYIQKFTNIK